MAKAIRKLYEIRYRTYNALVYLTNKCESILSILEKQFAKICMECI